MTFLQTLASYWWAFAPVAGIAFFFGFATGGTGGATYGFREFAEEVWFRSLIGSVAATVVTVFPLALFAYAYVVGAFA